MLGKQFVVIRMSAYPNPKKTALNRRGNCAVIGADTGRPNFTDFLELQRRMRKIGL
jgi:hypothetical protein